jgi:hypothetical protein
MKRGHKIFFSFAAAFLFAFSSFGILNYGMVVSNPGFVALTTKTTVPNFNNVCGDQMVSSPINLGFTFTYDGNSYTQFEMSDNGQIFLGAPAISCNSNCGPTCTFPNGIEPANLSGGTNRPAICPLWDDLGFTAAGAMVNYQMTGSAPNRMMTVEWLLMDWKYNNTGSPHGGISFQVILYESPAGQIDFIYRQEAQPLGVGTQSPNARIGLMGTTSGDYYSTNVTGSTITKSSEFSVATKPATGIRFRWTVPGGLPVELMSFSGKYDMEKVLLDWKTASEKNNDYFIVERSSNARDFEALGQLKGKGNSETESEYNFTDPDPPVNNVVIYYRLQQNDFNTRKTYSNIIEIRIPDAEKPPEIFFQSSSSVLKIIPHSYINSAMRIQVLDISGKLLWEKTLNGNNQDDILTFTLPPGMPGIYFASVTGEHGEIISKTRFIRD